MNSFHQGAVVFKHHGEGDQEDQVVWQKRHFGHSTTFDFQSSWASYERGSIAPTSFLGYKCKATGPSLKSLAISMKYFGWFRCITTLDQNHQISGVSVPGNWDLSIYFGLGGAYAKVSSGASATSVGSSKKRNLPASRASSWRKSSPASTKSSRRNKHIGNLQPASRTDAAGFQHSQSYKRPEDTKRLWILWLWDVWTSINENSCHSQRG